ncbi:hypothetical protein BW247_06915 [Acidihalobacter ferrooxydans]|uniref:DUF2334 domain-containing protein n=1 Tax=Acidihalobacter ferrooxydans TaxID=1765967 RepID=A0A1P8UL84_9GAMM|nr:hypothetical protein BW247_06915 [Acidihalobacter ferrooxydans]
MSIHDVAPATLTRVEALAARIERTQHRATLLIIPDSGWDDASLTRLRALLARGHVPAGHGWTHRIERWGGWRHRLHGWLISNRAAEHLGEDSAGCERIILRCYRWFADNALPPPALYVPPAWAMGPISRARLKTLPFQYYETLSGVYDASSARFVRLPLLGYEADRAWRAQALRLNNRLNRQWAKTSNHLRIALHPGDLEGPLGGDLLDLFEALEAQSTAQASPKNVMADGQTTRASDVN